MQPSDPSASGKASSTDSFTVRVRTNFAVFHLRAAVDAALRTYKAEQQSKEGKQEDQTSRPQPPSNDILMLVPVSVTMSGFSLEANVNEIIQDILDGSTDLPVTEGRKELLIDFKKDRSGNSLEKYTKVALLFDKIPDKGRSEWENAKLLVQFRNELAHFKPAWSSYSDGENDTNKNNINLLKNNNLTIHPAYERTPRFPEALMTYNNAKWSVNSVLKSSALFCNLLNIKNRYEIPNFFSNLP
ncbi:MAG: hypothetical protein KGL12_15935 [Rhodospirillales bacterium]|nr:hypothetical protein [Rhodospirillales bacterium]